MRGDDDVVDLLRDDVAGFLRDDAAEFLQDCYGRIKIITE